MATSIVMGTTSGSTAIASGPPAASTIRRATTAVIDTSTTASGSQAGFTSSGLSSTTASNTPLYKTVYVTTTATPSASRDHTIGGSGLTIGALIGIAIAGFALLLIIIGIIFYLLRRRRKTNRMHLEIPSSSGSRGHIVEEKRSSDFQCEYAWSADQVPRYSEHIVHELEVHAPKQVVKRPELDGRSRPRDLERGASQLAARNIMSRGRPVRRGTG